MSELRIVENGTKLQFKFKVDWQTPDKYLDAAREVLGEIDLDPNSSDRAQERVRAKEYYTRKNSGMDVAWKGRVWLNPAYDMLPACVEKLHKHYYGNDITQAILFTHTLTTWEPWFQSIIQFSDSFCFINELVEWYPGHLPDMGMAIMFHGKPEYDTRGTIAAYYGPNRAQFGEVFRHFGVIK